MPGRVATRSVAAHGGAELEVRVFPLHLLIEALGGVRSRRLAGGRAGLRGGV